MRKYINKQTDTSLSNLTDWRDVFLVGSTLAMIVAFVGIGWLLLNKDDPSDTLKQDIIAAIIELDRKEGNRYQAMQDNLKENTLAQSTLLIDKLESNALELDHSIGSLKKAIETNKRHQHERFVKYESEAKAFAAKKAQLVAANKPKKPDLKPRHHHVFKLEPIKLVPPAQPPKSTVDEVKQPKLDYDPANNKVVEVK